MQCGSSARKRAKRAESAPASNLRPPSIAAQGSRSRNPLDVRMLERALEERRAQSSISERVKWILKRLLAGNRPEMDVKEVAFLLGYEDSNSFYRAFRTWEGTTPSQLRAALRRPETRR